MTKKQKAPATEPPPPPDVLEDDEDNEAAEEIDENEFTRRDFEVRAPATGTYIIRVKARSPQEALWFSESRNLAQWLLANDGVGKVSTILDLSRGIEYEADELEKGDHPLFFPFWSPAALGAMPHTTLKGAIRFVRERVRAQGAPFPHWRYPVFGLHGDPVAWVGATGAFDAEDGRKLCPICGKDVQLPLHFADNKDCADALANLDPPGRTKDDP